jgi:hypothetical protein
MMRRAFWPLPLVLAIVGCGAGGKSYAPLTSPMTVPDRNALGAIAQRPLPPVEPRDEVAVDSWSFEGSWMTPEAEAPVPRPEALSVIEDAGMHGAPLLHCVAEQVARFFLTNGGLPDERLATYMTVRCGGVTSGRLAMGVWPAEGTEATTDEEMLTIVRPLANEDIGAVASEDGKAMDAGSWYHRNGAKAAIAVVARPRGDSVMVSTVSDAGRVVIQGAQSKAGETVSGLINRGPLGWSECAAAPPKGKQFQLTCDLAEGDDQAWIEVVSQPKDRLLATAVARTLVHRRGPTAITFPTIARGAPVTAPAALRQAVIVELNQLRTGAKMTPLTLAPQQSVAVDQVVPHFFAAGASGDGSLLDRIALGVGAGWEVQGGLIRDADFSATHVSGPPDAKAWLAATLERPLGRRVLLDPHAHQIAIGAAFDQPFPGVAALIASYRLYDPADAIADKQALAKALNDERARRGLAPANFVKIDELDDAVASIAQGTHPEQALQDALDRAASHATGGVNGAVGITVDPSALALPEELINRPTLAIDVRLIHQHHAPTNWGFFVVLAASTQSPSALKMAGEPARRSF